MVRESSSSPKKLPLPPELLLPWMRGNGMELAISKGTEEFNLILVNCFLREEEVE